LIPSADKINQLALDNMKKYAADDLFAVTGSVDRLTTVSNQCLYDERLYFQLMLAARLELYNDLEYVPPAGILVNKAADLGGTLVLGSSFPTSFPYLKTNDITDWSIVGGFPNPYKYLDSVTDIWGPEAYSTTYDGKVSTTFRNFVSFSSVADRIRVGVRAHTNTPSTVWDISIGERSGVTFGPVVGTDAVFTFDGDNKYVLIPSKTEVYTDWLDYSVDNVKSYFITMFCEDAYSGTNSNTGCWWIAGNVANELAWDTFQANLSGDNAGTHTHRPRCLFVIQGQSLTPSVGWDGDANILKWIESYNNLVPLIWNKPYGTKYMFEILTKANTSLGVKKTMITDRNLVIEEF
jgi:hypothetical protein